MIDQHPEVVAKMKADYDKWWQETQPHINIKHHIVIGNDAENPMMLSCMTWAETYFTQKKRILEGSKANGWWNLEVDKAGTYSFELRRWPSETGAALQDAVGVKYTDTKPYGPGKEGKALDIAEARIKIASHNQKLKVNKGDKSASFKLQLKQGPTKLQTWFYDKGNHELCGAYYVYVKRL